MKSRVLVGLRLVGSLAAACGDDTPTTPSSASSSVTLTAALLPSSEVSLVSFYLNIHTAANPGGVARGRLTLTQ